MLGQTFCGHSGHGLWQGIWLDAAEAVIGPVAARTMDVFIGMTIIAPSMAIMPTTKKHRW